MKRSLQFSWGALLTSLAVCGLSTATHAQIQITEVMYNATNDNVWEWIEIRNTGGAAVDLNGYLGFNLGDANIAAPNPTINSALDPDTVVNPGEIAVIYDGFYNTGNVNNYVDQKFRDAWGLGAGIKLIAADFFPGLSNTEGNQGQSVGFWPNLAAWQADQTAGITTGFANATFSINFSGAAYPAPDGNSSMTWSGNGSIGNGSDWLLSANGDATGAVTSIIVNVPGTGFKNSTTDVANPGMLPTGTPSVAGLQITEIMYDPASVEDDWEWLEVYNSSGAAIDLTGWVVDDSNVDAQVASNIASGSVPAGGTAILYNSEDVTAVDFATAWGATLNLVPVTGWGLMGLNNDRDAIGLWSSFASYSGNNAFDITLNTGHANAVVNQVYNETATVPFPTGFNGPSIFLGSLDDVSFDPDLGSSWVNAAAGDGLSSNATGVPQSGSVVLHPGGDNGSPGTFTVVSTGTPGDFDGDTDVDGRDFLAWQRGESPVPFSAADLATWQGAYNGGLLSAVSVPEPTSLAILALALVPMACGRKR